MGSYLVKLIQSPTTTYMCVYINVKVAVLLGSVAGAAAEALEKAAGTQTRPAHSPTGTALLG